MAKKINKTDTPNAGTLIDGPHRKSSVNVPAGPWPHGPNAPTDGRTLVTPEMAREWLKANICNRRPKPAAVRKVKNLLTAGRFRFNAQTVTFTRSWRMIDGQHRLIAIAETGIAGEILVWTGLDDDVADTINTGVAGDRSSAEAWGIKNGKVPPKDDVARVNACWTALTSATTRDADEYGTASAAFMDGISAVAPVFTAHNHMCRSSIVAGFAIAWKIGGPAVVELARKYMSCEGMLKGDPMLVLSRWGSRQPKNSEKGGGSGRRAYESRVVLGLVLDALTGESRSIIRPAGEAEINRARKAHGLEASR